MEIFFYRVSYFFKGFFGVRLHPDAALDDDFSGVSDDLDAEISELRQACNRARNCALALLKFFREMLISGRAVALHVAHRRDVAVKHTSEKTEALIIPHVGGQD